MPIQSFQRQTTPAALAEDTQHRFGVLHFASLLVFECPNHLSHFALQAAFPPSLAGRYSR